MNLRCHRSREFLDQLRKGPVKGNELAQFFLFSTHLYVGNIRELMRHKLKGIITG
jgi:hypothetical protein